MSLLKAFPFWLQTLLGLTLGVLAGLYWGQSGVIYFDAIGDSFINLIKMLVVPLVFFTIASSVARFGQQTGAVAVKLGLQTLLWFVVTAAIAVGIGLLIGHYFQPGLNVGHFDYAPKDPKTIPTPLAVLMGIFPSNMVAAFAEGKTLSVLFIALLTGAGLGALGDATKDLRALIDQAAQLMFKLTRWIIKLTPLGVFGLIASLVAAYGLEAIRPLLGFIGLIYLGCAVILLVIYPLLLKVHGLSVFAFYRGIFTAQQTAFFTCSSLGTLPISLTVAKENLKLDPAYVGFAVPLGANMKMDACGGIYPAIAAIFIANYFGVPLSPGHYGIIAMTAVLGSLATAGIPSAATVMLTLTLSAAGLPIEGLAVVAGIDRIIDMIRTTTNVTGQIVVPTLVARENGLVGADSPLWGRRKG